MYNRSYQFEICEGGSVALVDGTLLRPGTRLTGQQLEDRGIKPATVEDWLKTGHAKVVTRTTPITSDPNARVENPPGRGPILPVPTEQTITPEPGQDRIVVNTGGLTATSSTQPVEPVKQVESKWTLDPAKLKGKTIAQLNVMVAERDSTVHPFDTVEEATLFLSQDFNRKP